MIRAGYIGRNTTEQAKSINTVILDLNVIGEAGLVILSTGKDFQIGRTSIKREFGISILFEKHSVL